MPKPNSGDWFTNLRKTIRETFQNISTEIYDLFEERPSYIQFRMDVTKITEEFENYLKEKIDHSILHAEVRKASIEDVESLFRIYNETWRSSSMPFRQVNKETFLKLFKQPYTTFLIANVNSIDGGFILIHLEGEKNELGIINGFATLPEFQNKGLGTTLAMAAWKYFKERDVKELRCEVHKDNKITYSFIKSLGFEELR
jgi:ribosomal protein S18 acetylase RimI-like enzyme